MTYEMATLYKKLNTNKKRNELSSLIIKIDQLLNQVLVQNKIIDGQINKIKNYDSINQALDSEDDILLFFYDDLWKIKNKLLKLLVLNSQK